MYLKFAEKILGKLFKKNLGKNLTYLYRDKFIAQ